MSEQELSRLVALRIVSCTREYQRLCGDPSLLGDRAIDKMNNVARSFDDLERAALAYPVLHSMIIVARDDLQNSFLSFFASSYHLRKYNRKAQRKASITAEQARRID